MAGNPFFSDRLRQLREDAGLTQRELAKLARVPIRTLQQWEQYNATPVSVSFFRLARALGVSADEFGPRPGRRMQPRRRGRGKRK